MSYSPAVVLFRQDLRLHDNPAFWHAAHSGAPLIALYILDDKTPGKWKIGGAQRWWLYHSLKALQKSLKKLGIDLIALKGSKVEILKELIAKYLPQAIYINRCYEPFAIEEESSIQKMSVDIPIHLFKSTLFTEPGTISNNEGKPYKVFTHFYHTWSKLANIDEPLPEPKGPLLQFQKLRGEDIENWGLLPSHPNWAIDFSKDWTPGEEGAKNKLVLFAKESMSDYAVNRDIPSKKGTSFLSPHLHFGEISVRQIYKKLFACSDSCIGREIYLKELVWREFAYHLLFFFPKMSETSFQKRFQNFPWKSNSKLLKSWQMGVTGYPIVDAGMRQLWRTGFMHNRVRMIVGSFLTKDLLIPWQEGEQWFWDTLVDADLASNAMNWQWVAGCGVDAAPFFRIFNPVLQGEKFDTEGVYVKEWVPELAKLPAKYIHRPWEAPPLLLAECGVVLGKDYPYPIVDHAEARDRALKLFKEWK